MKSFILIIKFLTAIPLPFEVEYNQENLRKGNVYIPFVGVIIGLFLFLVNYLSSFLSYDLLSSVFVVMTGVLVTGGIHIDGLADTFDAIFSYRSKERMLEIMKDPRLGTFGGIALFFVLLLKVVLILGITKAILWKVLLVTPVFGRLGMIWCAGTSKYARENSGMGSPTIDFTGFREIAIATGITILYTSFFLHSALIFPLIVTIIFTLLFTRFICSKIGGTTGDILGAVTELSETFVLFTFLIIEKLPSLKGFLC